VIFSLVKLFFKVVVLVELMESCRFDLLEYNGIFYRGKHVTKALCFDKFCGWLHYKNYRAAASGCIKADIGKIILKVILDQIKFIAKKTI
jgi:hypothetical protein